MSHLMNQYEAARFLGLPASRLEQLVRAGVIRYVDVGLRPGAALRLEGLRFDPADLRAFIDGRRRNLANTTLA